MISTILSINTMPCGLVHTVKRPTVGEPWTEHYTALEPGDQWVLRPTPARIEFERDGVDLDSWFLVSPLGSAYRVTLAQGLNALRSRLG